MADKITMSSQATINENGESNLVYYRDDVDDRYVEFSDASYIAVKWD